MAFYFAHGDAVEAALHEDSPNPRPDIAVGQQRPWLPWGPPPPEKVPRRTVIVAPQRQSARRRTAKQR
eukprot:1307863-Alexandrium_andersonii.AAC.1